MPRFEDKGISEYDDEPACDRLAQARLKYLKVSGTSKAVPTTYAEMASIAPQKPQKVTINPTTIIPIYEQKMVSYKDDEPAIDAPDKQSENGGDKNSDSEIKSTASILLSLHGKPSVTPNDIKTIIRTLDGESSDSTVANTLITAAFQATVTNGASRIDTSERNPLGGRPCSVKSSGKSVIRMVIFYHSRDIGSLVCYPENWKPGYYEKAKAMQGILYYIHT